MSFPIRVGGSNHQSHQYSVNAKAPAAAKKSNANSKSNIAQSYGKHSHGGAIEQLADQGSLRPVFENGLRNRFGGGGRPQLSDKKSNYPGRGHVGGSLRAQFQNAVNARYSGSGRPQLHNDPSNYPHRGHDYSGLPRLHNEPSQYPGPNGLGHKGPAKPVKHAGPAKAKPAVQDEFLPNDANNASKADKTVIASNAKRKHGAHNAPRRGAHNPIRMQSGPARHHLRLRPNPFVYYPNGRDPGGRR